MRYAIYQIVRLDKRMLRFGQTILLAGFYMRSFKILLTFCLPLIFNSSLSAITIDEFSGQQYLLAIGASGSASSAGNVVDSDLAIGGSRSVFVKSGSSGTLEAATSTCPAPAEISAATGQTVVDCFTHSQSAQEKGTTQLVWDADTLVGLTKPAGLGAVDLLDDSATAFSLGVLSYDYPGNKALPIVVTVYDAGDPSGNTWSQGTLILAEYISTYKVLQLPFSAFTQVGPGGAADFSNVGAIEMTIQGTANPAHDLIINFFGTNGSCGHVPVNGLIKDQCGVCNGDNSSMDRCGVCNGDGNSCLDCESFDQSDDLRIMDGGAKKLERRIKDIAGIVRRLYQTKAVKKEMVAIAATSHELQLRNWTISWQFPIISTICENTSFCINSTTTALKDEYRQHNEELWKLFRKVYRYIKQVRPPNSSERATFKETRAIYLDNLKRVNERPEFQSSCSEPE